MAIDYTEFVALAQELIADAGRLCKVQKLSATPADALKPWMGAAAPTVQTERQVRAVFVPPSGTDFGKDFISPELLQRAMQVALIAPTDISLEQMNLIEDGGVKWKVEWVQVLKPADLIVLYAFGVSR